MKKDQEIEELYLDYARLVLIGYSSCAVATFAAIIALRDANVP